MRAGGHRPRASSGGDLLTLAPCRRCWWSPRGATGVQRHRRGPPVARGRDAGQEFANTLEMTAADLRLHLSRRSAGAAPRAGVSLGVRALAAAHRSGARTSATPSTPCSRRLDGPATRRRGSPARPDALLARADGAARRGPRGAAALGVPFAVKDNIDVAGLPTTAGVSRVRLRRRRDRATVVDAARATRARSSSARPTSTSSRPGSSARARRTARARTPFDAALHLRRLELGLGGRRRARAGQLRARHRHRRLGPRAGRVQQHRRAEADARAWSARAASCRRAARSTASRSSRAPPTTRRRCSARARGYDAGDPFSRRARRPARRAVATARSASASRDAAALEFFGDGRRGRRAFAPPASGSRRSAAARRRDRLRAVRRGGGAALRRAVGRRAARRRSARSSSATARRDTRSSRADHPRRRETFGAPTRSTRPATGWPALRRRGRGACGPRSTCCCCRRPPTLHDAAPRSRPSRSRVNTPPRRLHELRQPARPRARSPCPPAAAPTACRSASR